MKSLLLYINMVVMVKMQNLYYGKNIISIFHLHIHIIPRYMNDVPNPKG